MKKNTRIKWGIAGVIAVISCVIHFIGDWNDITGFNWKGFLEICKFIFSLLEAHSVAVTIAIVVLVVAAYFIWLYHTTKMNRRETEKFAWFDAK